MLKRIKELTEFLIVLRFELSYKNKYNQILLYLEAGNQFPKHCMDFFDLRLSKSNRGISLSSQKVKLVQ